jgi:transposase
MTTAPLSSPPAGGGASGSKLPSPEVLEFPTRRRFSAAYKLRIVQAADAAAETKQIGALLRREGLHSSHLVAWRRLRDAGALQALSQPRGRKPSDLQAATLARLERENAQLRRRLDVAELVIDVQKKLSQALGITLPETEPLP